MSNSDYQNVYALVVGIEKYSENWPSLDGPASDALNFAEWLCKIKFPENNIFIHISEWERNQKLVEEFKKKHGQINLEKATDAIYKTLNETIRKLQGETLYIFWGGHGITDIKQVRRLFYDDGAENLNVTDLLNSIKTDYFNNFNKHIILIDACAKYAQETNDLPGYLPDRTFEKGKHNPSEQFVLYATKEGYGARNDDNQKTGLFSQELLKLLTQETKLPSPEDMKRITTNLQKIFKTKYKNLPRPIYLWWQDGDGNQKRDLLTNVSALSNSSEPQFITDQELFKELLKLNYSSEYRTFNQKIKKNAANLILLCGTKNNGIEMLKEKLISPLINSVSTTEVKSKQTLSDLSIEPWSISLNGNLGLDASFLWQSLGKYLKLGTNGTKDQVIEKITSYCRQRSIIIVFGLSEIIPPFYFDDIIKEVSKPLFTQINKDVAEDMKKANNKFLIFFLDYNQQFSELDEEQLCKLLVNNFDESDVEHWMENAAQQFTFERLPPDFEPEQASVIYNDSEKDGIKGNPRLVYKNIYQLCQINWSNSEVHKRVG